MSRRTLRCLTAAIWVAVVILAGDFYYLNHYTPRGPLYGTGDPACERGSCGEGMTEDVSKIDLPDWQKEIKRDGFMFIVALSILGIIVGVKAKQSTSNPS